MIDVALAFPFTLGMVAAFNPCGFAMLPAYLSYFLGLDDGEAHTPWHVLRGLVIGLAMSAGFFVVFGIAGLLFNTVIPQRWLEHLGWFTIVAGALIVVLGIAMFAGFELTVRLPRPAMGTGSRQVSSVFLFGVSYAVVSLGCSLPIFIPNIIDSFTKDGLVEGMAVFVSYAVGMSMIVVLLTMAIALARSSVATSMRRLLPYVNRLSGVLLVLAGIYLVSYGIDSLETFDDPANAEASRFQHLAEDFESHVVEWVDEVGATRIGWAVTVLIGALLVAGLRPLMRSERNRLMVTGGLLSGYAVLELGWYQAELLLLPVARFIVDVPMRIGNWFTDPVRWGVPLELALFATIVAVSIAVVRGRAHDPSRESEAMAA